MKVYCTKADPPQVKAAEEVLDMLTNSGLAGPSGPDRSFFYQLMMAHVRLGAYEKVTELYRELPKRYQGGDGAALTALAYSYMKRPDMLPGLVKATSKGTTEFSASAGMGKQQRRQPELITPEILLELVNELADKCEWLRAREVVEILLERGLPANKASRVGATLDLIRSQASSGTDDGSTVVSEAREVLDGLELLLLSHGVAE